ncbi:DNA replication complex GINS protein PSF1-like [Eriocheir sinensis]|uniref:DNA replication complex GINS protein PSF1-like n=1 Tax=Eriocheir sinensis TaxID=95602 RepID=UPI0021C948AD|nr:DNA replication complex GINS protein PSF1-like [Eriocheir sinensis]
MLGEKALELVKEMDRARDGRIPVYNHNHVRDVLEEMSALFQKNQEDVHATVSGENRYFPGIHLRHAALERNKRCLLAYLYNRLERIKEIRWDCGSILPAEVRENLCHSEMEWFARYNKNLGSYMRSLGDGVGLDLTVDIRPPKNIYVEVRCLKDHGEYEMEEGDVVVLKKNTTHYLPMKSCQHLIRDGILQQLE